MQNDLRKGLIKCPRTNKYFKYTKALWGLITSIRSSAISAIKVTATKLSVSKDADKSESCVLLVEMQNDGDNCFEKL